MIPDNKRAMIKQNNNQTSSIDQTDLLHQLNLSEEAIAEMAADPEIQKEIRLINAEFADTEEDGLSD
ncbi:MAG: hypothetical protein H0X30_17645 [Anaerolineae bacterium]|nr:hypothetical protein [Anaerolineae bacterium]